MNSKERVLSAMNLCKTDKVPLMCQFSFGHMLRQLNVSPVDFWYDCDTFAMGLIQLRDLYQFDGILVSLTGHSKKWRTGIKSVTDKNNTCSVTTSSGERFDFPENELPINRTEKIYPSINEVEISSLPQVLDYIPVSQNLIFKFDTANKFNVIEEIIRLTDGAFSVHGEITSPFDYLLDLIGHQEGLLALLLEPEKCKDILNHFTRLIKEYALEMCMTGIDAIKISSPFAGEGFISPGNYQEFVLPYEKEIATAIREKNIHVYTHTCGSIDDRLEMMFEAGISGIECLDPVPLGNVELSDAFERIGNRGFIKGNIDSVNTLLYGDKDLIIKDVKDILQKSKNHDGFILSTACSIAPDVNRGNILLLRKLVEEFGKR